MSAAASHMPAQDAVVAAMVAAGWSDAQIGAALRAALCGALAQPSHLTVATGGQEAHLGAEGGQPSQNATVAPVAHQPSQNAFHSDGRMKHWADAKALAKQRDPMLAAVAFEAMPGLTRVHRAIGIVLIRRFYNAKSGRCDPAVGTVAKAARCDRATVFRAIKVFERMGLMVRHSYAGHGHTNAYQPNWDRCAEVVASWQQSQNDRNVGQPSQEPSHNATQTQTENINTSTSGEIQRGGGTPVPKPKPNPKPRGKPHVADRRQINLMMPIPGGLHTASQGAVAHKKATQRLWAAFNDLHKGRGQMFANSISRDAWEDGVQAEMAKAGSGLAVLQDALMPQPPRRAGTGPP